MNFEAKLMEWAASAGCVLTEHPLRARPDLRHWHLRKPKNSGTVEVTWEPGVDPVVECRVNRQGEWTEHALAELRKLLRMEYRYSTDPPEVDWAHMKTTLEGDDFGNGRTAEEYRLCAEHSHLNVFVFHGEQLVGNARSLSDGVCNAYLVDVWTHSAHRRKGVATKMVEILCDSVRGQHVYLQTEDRTDFYETLGFDFQPHGMSRVVGRWLNR